MVTCGSPVANHPIPERTWVTSVQIDDELVAALDGAANPATENWLTVTGTVHKAPGSLTTSVSEEGYCVPGIGPGAEDPFTAASVRDTGEDKEITHWLKYHQAAYQNATDLGSPAVQRHEAHFQEVSGFLYTRNWRPFPQCLLVYKKSKQPPRTGSSRAAAVPRPSGPGICQTTEPFLPNTRANLANS